MYDENAHDFLPVKLGISKNDKLVAQKSALCAKLGLSALVINEPSDGFRHQSANDGSSFFISQAGNLPAPRGWQLERELTRLSARFQLQRRSVSLPLAFQLSQCCCFDGAEQVSAWLGREDLSPLTTKNTEDALLLDVDKKARQFLEARAALLLRAYPEEINDVSLDCDLEGHVIDPIKLVNSPRVIMVR